MIRFRTFLLEYLTDEQRNRHKDVHMTDKARADTDHFFGVGNDKIHGTIEHGEKSEIHRQLENHLGQTISHEDYSKGTIKDKYGRDAKIGRLIKDENLRIQFDKDPARKIGTSPTLKTTTVRGTDVAGQTNSAPNPEHPKGHSWGEMSCKNVDTGINKHYLDNEIQHGTVVHFVHDNNGQEIYRATLQPHHNDEGHVAYAVDAEYGIKHPKFTADAERVAKELSGKYKPGVFTKHPEVYNDSGDTFMQHPGATPEHLDQELRSELAKPYEQQHPGKLRMLLTHPKMPSKALSHALDVEESPTDVWILAAKHKNLTGDVLDKALSHERPHVVRQAIANPNTTAQHLHRILDTSKDWKAKRDVFYSPNADSSHIEKAIKEGDPDILEAASNHHKATPDQLDRMSNMHGVVHDEILAHPNVTSWNIDRWLDSDNPRLRQGAASHPKATEANINKALSKGVNKEPGTVFAAFKNPNIKPHQLEPFIRHSDPNIRAQAVQSRGMSSEQIHHVLDHDDNPNVLRHLITPQNNNLNSSHLQKIFKGDYNYAFKVRAASHHNMTPESIDAAIDTGLDTVGATAISRRNATHDNLTKAMKTGSEHLENEVLWHSNSTPEHWKYIADHSKHDVNKLLANRFIENGQQG